MAGNKALLAALYDQAAYTTDPHEGTHWSLQHHDADRDEWVEVGRFPTKKVAQLSLDALVADGHGTSAGYRIREVTIAPHI